MSECASGITARVVSVKGPLRSRDLDAIPARDIPIKGPLLRRDLDATGATRRIAALIENCLKRN